MQQITALGGITGGSGYQQCLVFQQILHENFDDVRVTVSGTDGWKADAKLMWSQGNAEFGIVPAGDAYNILHGNDPYGEERNYILQAYPAVPPTYLHVVVRKDGDIQEYADLEGKRINVLSRGSLTNAIQPRVMDALGYEPEEYLHYPHQEAAGALKQGDIDAVVGAGVAAPYQEMSQQMPVEVVSLSESEKEPINEGIPWLGFTTVDFSEYYNGASESLVPAPWTVMACQKSLDEDFVYETVKTVFDNVDLASQIYDPASQLDPSLAPKTRVPVHPGAYRYYQEQNVEIPDELQPPESLPLSE
jgi:TRAP transporter TAXI family solute receptor